MGILEEKDGEATPAQLQPVLRRMCALYGLWSLERNLTSLYQGLYEMLLRSDWFDLLFLGIQQLRHRIQLLSELCRRFFLYDMSDLVFKITI